MDNNSQTEHRLDRIESKLDALSETIISIARAEEKLTSLEKEKLIIWRRIEHLEEDQKKHDVQIIENKGTIQVLNRVFWIVITLTASTTIGAIATLVLK